jgi:hypothetical protein
MFELTGGVEWRSGVGFQQGFNPHHSKVAIHMHPYYLHSCQHDLRVVMLYIHTYIHTYMPGGKHN